MRYIAWLDSDESSESPKPSALHRALAFIAGICIVARLMLVYVVVPCVFVVAVIVVILALRLPTLVGGILFALAFGSGVAVYFDRVVR